MYIEDQEFREIYETVTPERLEKLESSLLILEKNPQDVDSLEEFLREAHTLKGDSRMLGVTDVETLIHQMEDTMINVKQGDANLTSHLCDRFHSGLDAVRLLVNEAVTGESSGVNTFMVLAELIGSDDEQSGTIDDLSNELDSTGDMGADTPSDDPDTDSLFDLEDQIDADDLDIFADSEEIEASVSGNSAIFALDESSLADVDIEQSPASVEVSPNDLEIKLPQAQSANKFQRRSDDIATVRVKTEDLDKLVRQTSELSIAQININRRLVNISDMMGLWEQLHYSFAYNQKLIQKINADAKNSSQGNIKLLEKLGQYQTTSSQQLEDLGHLINRLQSSTLEDNATLSAIAQEMDEGVKSLRLLPLSIIFKPLRRVVREISREQNKQVDLIIEGAELKVDKQIIDQMKDPLLHLMRNAVDHGIETISERKRQGKSEKATIVLKGYQLGSSIIIELEDDGKGLNLDRIKQKAIEKQIVTPDQLLRMSTNEIQDLIFASGFSTRSEVSEISGRGVGLDVVRNNVSKLKGSINVESTPNSGCTFRLQLKTSLGNTEALLIKASERIFALPLDMIETIRLIQAEDIYTLKGSRVININDQPISVVWLANVLNLPTTTPNSTQELDRANRNISCLILGSGKRRLGILVDEVVDQQDIVLKPQSALLQRVRNIAGATILSNGEVCSVLNAQDLIDSISGKKSNSVLQKAKTETLSDVTTPSKVLLVEDSIIIRKQMERILDQGGYIVTSAVDGQDGFDKLPTDNFDFVISDVEMPNMNGLELTAKIREQPQYQELPIVLVTTLAKPEDKQRGFDAGANAYLTKGDFDQELLMETLEKLI